MSKAFVRLKTMHHHSTQRSWEPEALPRDRSNLELQTSLMLLLTVDRPVTIEEVVEAFPGEKWMKIFEALAQFHRQERVHCRISDHDLKLTAA